MDMENKRLVLTQTDFSRLTNLINHEKEVYKRRQDNLQKMLDELKKAIIVTPDEIDNNVVTINSVVKFTDLITNMNIQLKIVYPKNANINKKYVSILSPIGTALLGCKKGETVDRHIAGSKKRYFINEVIYQP
jgi:regulator of nucleoside diphosphate kinase